MIRFLIVTLGLVAVAGAAKRRALLSRLSGRTPDEARALIVDKVTQRTGDPARAELMADRIVAKLDQRGVLAAS